MLGCSLKKNQDLRTDPGASTMAGEMRHVQYLIR